MSAPVIEEPIESLDERVVVVLRVRLVEQIEKLCSARLARLDDPLTSVLRIRRTVETLQGNRLLTNKGVALHGVLVGPRDAKRHRPLERKPTKSGCDERAGLLLGDVRKAPP